MREIDTFDGEYLKTDNVELDQSGAEPQILILNRF